MLWTPKKRRIARPDGLVCSLLGLGLGFGGGGGQVQASSVAFSSGNRYESAAGAFSAEDPGTIRIRMKVLTVPNSGIRVMCAFSGSGTGFIVWTQDKSGGTLSNPQLCVFAGVDGGIPQVAEKVILSEQVGTILTLHIVFERVGGVGTKVRVYLDGEEIGLGAVTAGFGVGYTTYNRPSAALALGDLPGGGFPGEQAIVEMAWSATAFTAAQVRTDNALGIGVAMSGETHHWTASPTLGATWTDTGSGAKNLTRTGTPTISTGTALLARVKRTFNAWGDSITQGQRPGPITTGDSWRRRLQHLLQGAGRGITWVGGSFPTSPVTPDYDYWNNGSGGESLVTRLGTFASDLPNAGGNRVGSVISYGTNDFMVSSRTASQFATDLQTAVTTHQTARPGAPVLITCPMPVGSSIGTAPQRAQLASFRSSWATTLATIKAACTNGAVEGVDLGLAISNPDDTSQLFDGVHPTLTIYDALADLMYPAMLTLAV